VNLIVLNIIAPRVKEGRDNDGFENSRCRALIEQIKAGLSAEKTFVNASSACAAGGAPS
jgi:hypothetical protein